MRTCSPRRGIRTLVSALVTLSAVLAAACGKDGGGRWGT